MKSFFSLLIAIIIACCYSIGGAAAAPSTIDQANAKVDTAQAVLETINNRLNPLSNEYSEALKGMNKLGESKTNTPGYNALYSKAKQLEPQIEKLRGEQKKAISELEKATGELSAATKKEGGAAGNAAATTGGGKGPSTTPAGQVDPATGIRWTTPPVGGESKAQSPQPQLDYSSIGSFRDAYDRVGQEGDGLENSLVLESKYGSTDNFELMLRALGNTLRNIGSLVALVVILLSGVQMVVSSDGAAATSSTFGRIAGATTGLLFMQAAPLLYDIFSSSVDQDFGRGTGADITGSSWLVRVMNDFTTLLLEPFVDLAVGFLPLVLTAVIVYCGFMIIASGGDTSKYVNGIIGSIAGMIVILVGKVAVVGIYGSRGFAPDTERISGLVGDVANYIFYLMGPVIIGLIIYGGYMAVVNATDDGAVGKAVGIIRYAVIGLVIMLSSYVLVNTLLV